MIKRALPLFLFLSLSLLWLAGRASAQRNDVVRYDDAGLVSIGDVSIYYWYPPGKIEPNSLIRNGDFQAWQDGQPENWTVWVEHKPGWEDAHIAQIDYAVTEEGENNAFGLFVRNVGGEGSYYAGAYQQLDQVEEAGYYWLTTHMTMWGEVPKVLYNSVGWYGIGDSADPASVGDWRELSPLPIPCPNQLRVCIHVGRYETIYVEPGQYFHLRVGHNFPAYNVWTVFGLDDFALSPAGGEVIEDGFWPDGLVYWDPRELR